MTSLPCGIIHIGRRSHSQHEPSLPPGGDPAPPPKWQFVGWRSTAATPFGLSDDKTGRQQRVVGRPRAVASEGQLAISLPTCSSGAHGRRPHWLALAAPRPATRSTSTSAYRSTLNRNVPRKLICEKSAGPIRRSQSSSISRPLRSSRTATPSMRLVFQASTMLVNRACAPEMAAISCRRRPRSGATWPP